jgi:TRAP-type C4-dicarboxylate transport system permease small subunit
MIGRRPGIEHWLNEIMDKIRWPAAIVLFLMGLLTTADVIGRYVFLKPILGNSEIQELMMVVIIFLAMGYCTLKARHASADIVITHVSKRTQAILGSITWFLSAAIFALISWQAMRWGLKEIQSPSRVTMLLLIKEGPFILISAFGCLAICLGSLVNFVNALKRIPVSQEEK